jgi:uncharacterized protein
MQVSFTRKSLLAFAAIVALALAALLGITRSAQAQEGDDVTQRSITVSGFGETFGAPDTVYINVGVDKVSQELSGAVGETQAAIDSIITALGEAGVAAADIQTANYNIYPEDRYDPQSGQPTGERVYRVSVGMNIVVRDLSATSSVLTAALEAGATSVNGLTFGIADTSALESTARQNAVADARDRALQLAEAFGVTLGEVISVREVIQSYPVPLASARMDVAQGMGGAPQIAPGQLSVGINVEVTFAIG